MLILVLNCGSSSLKYQLFDMSDDKVLAKGICERIGIHESFLKHKHGDEEIIIKQDILDHKSAVEIVLNALVNKEHGVISSLDEISAIGHRIVHGGEHFKKSTLLTSENTWKVRDCIKFAPLHNPGAAAGIEACQALLPNTQNVGVFDTAFHQTMEPEAYLYGLPYKYYTEYQVRKYGAHGTSHKYVAKRAAEILGKDLKDLKLITCHIGGGASICAIKNGKSVDTSMGFTPLDGIVMGTRSGSIDPAIMEYVMERENLDIKQMTNVLNKESGVLGISGVSSDFRDLWTACDEGNARARLAIDISNYRIKKTVGSYIAALNGADAIVFTAGVGENDEGVREGSMSGLENLGIIIDKEINLTARKNENTIISTPESKVTVMVVKTNEELMIARDTMNIVNGESIE